MSVEGLSLTPGPEPLFVWSGGALYRSTDVAESWLSDDMMSGGAAFAMTGSDQGAYNSYSSKTKLASSVTDRIAARNVNGVIAAPKLTSSVRGNRHLRLLV